MTKLHNTIIHINKEDFLVHEHFMYISVKGIFSITLPFFFSDFLRKNRLTFVLAGISKYSYRKTDGKETRRN